jgi:hypothetical protein
VRERALPCLDAIDGDSPGSALAKAGAVIGKGEFDRVFPGRERGSAFDLWPGQIEEVVGEYRLSFEEIEPQPPKRPPAVTSMPLPPPSGRSISAVILKDLLRMLGAVACGTPAICFV